MLITGTINKRKMKISFTTNATQNKFLTRASKFLGSSKADFVRYAVNRALGDMVVIYREQLDEIALNYVRSYLQTHFKRGKNKGKPKKYLLSREWTRIKKLLDQAPQPPIDEIPKMVLLHKRKTRLLGQEIFFRGQKDDIWMGKSILDYPGNDSQGGQRLLYSFARDYLTLQIRAEFLAWCNIFGYQSDIIQGKHPLSCEMKILRKKQKLVESAIKDFESKKAFSDDFKKISNNLPVAFKEGFKNGDSEIIREGLSYFKKYILKRIEGQKLIKRLVSPRLAVLKKDHKFWNDPRELCRYINNRNESAALDCSRAGRLYGINPKRHFI